MTDKKRKRTGVPSMDEEKILTRKRVKSANRQDEELFGESLFFGVDEESFLDESYDH